MEIEIRMKKLSNYVLILKKISRYPRSLDKKNVSLLKYFIKIIEQEINGTAIIEHWII